jgi:hypothetical protein
MDPKRKFFLFKQAKHFCSVPWNYFKVDMSGNVTTCVNGKQVLGNLNDTDVKEILLNPKLADIKQNLSNDILDNNCKFTEVDIRHISNAGWKTITNLTDIATFADKIEQIRKDNKLILGNKNNPVSSRGILLLEQYLVFPLMADSHFGIWQLLKSNQNYPKRQNFACKF